MSDDDDDYMSSAFLEVKEDIRPGLTHSRSMKRKHVIEKRKEESRKMHYTKPRRELEEEQRNAGLDRALTSDNKGFALLQKMGYKPGMKLGKQATTPHASNSGLEEPIKVKIKAGRGGLGREELIRNRISEREKRKVEIKVWKEKETARLTEEYRQRMRDKVLMKQLSGDLRKSQKVCEQLDLENGVKEPLRPWFWFSNQENTEDYDEEEYYEEEEEDESLLEPEEQLSFILDYMRGKYCYCVWCGTKYDDDNDLDTNCPGTEKDDHE